MMRREGFEMMVSRPEIVTKSIDDELMEPVEHLSIDVPENFVGTVIERLGPRKGEMTKMANHGSGRVRMEFRIPSRGLIGLRSEMLTETRGTIIMNSILDGYIAYQGEIPQRASGALISDRQGTTTAYALEGLQDRGILFVPDGVEVYEGMVIGEHSRDNDLDVNCVREKKLSNMRASGSDDAVRLVPYKQLTLEQCIEFIADDELVEVTPKSLRMRKRVLQANRRPARVPATNNLAPNFLNINGWTCSQDIVQPLLLRQFLLLLFASSAVILNAVKDPEGSHRHNRSNLSAIPLPSLLLVVVTLTPSRNRHFDRSGPRSHRGLRSGEIRFSTPAAPNPHHAPAIVVTLAARRQNVCSQSVVAWFLFFLPFSAQKTHVKPLNHLTPYAANNIRVAR